MLTVLFLFEAGELIAFVNAEQSMAISIVMPAALYPYSFSFDQPNCHLIRPDMILQSESFKRNLKVLKFNLCCRCSEKSLLFLSAYHKG